MAALVGFVVVIAAVTWAGGALACLLSGVAVRGGAASGLLALVHPGDPGVGWRHRVGAVWFYWTVSAGVAAVAVAAVTWALARWSTGTVTAGVAGRKLVVAEAGTAQLRRRAKLLRPTIARPRAEDVGVCLGTARRVECWASVEDSLLVLGPPRSGKGLHLVIPAILDAPGAVVTTSTRPDNLALTLAARTSRGPVAVFDPQGLAAGVAGTMRWSPIRGCEAPATAMAPARALCTDSAGGMDNATFWSQQTRTAVRCLLHAAAIDHRPPADLLRWSLTPLAAEDAADILRTNAAAAASWSTALEAIIGADPRQRDSVWAMVANTFSALSDPAVLEAITPVQGQSLDPESLLREGGTLYLLGSASGAAATATLVSALIEDVVETARRLAAAAPSARLEQPLSLVLDEAANYPLPSLLPLMSEGGGSGISTMVVLQSLAQARARWGVQEAAAVWDSAIVKLILGGGGGADDLRALSSLLGQREEQQRSHSWSAGSGHSTSVSMREHPVFDVAALRTLPFGRAVLLLRTAPSIDLRMRPWTKRRDADDLRAARAEVETQLRSAATR